MKLTQSELLKAHVETIGGLFWQVKSEMGKVAYSPELGRVGQTAARLAILRKGQAAMKQTHEEFLAGAWADSEGKRQADNAAIVGKLRGLTPTQPSDTELYNMGLAGDGQKVNYRQQAAILSALEKLTVQTSVSTAIQRYATLPAEELTRRAGAYVTAAAGELKDFPVDPWLVDQEALEIALQAKAAAGESRAKMFLDQHPNLRSEIEVMASEQAVGPNLRLQAQAQFDRLLDGIEGLVKTDPASGQPYEDLQAGDITFGMQGPNRPQPVTAGSTDARPGAVEVPAGAKPRTS